MLGVKAGSPAAPPAAAAAPAEADCDWEGEAALDLGQPPRLGVMDLLNCMAYDGEKDEAVGGMYGDQPVPNRGVAPTKDDAPPGAAPSGSRRHLAMTRKGLVVHNREQHRFKGFELGECGPKEKQLGVHQKW